MSFSIKRQAVALACVAGLWWVGDAVAKPRHGGKTADPVAFSFAFFGCNRLDKDGVDATGSVSTANVGQLLKSFQDIAGLPKLPQYLFLAGDIVKAKHPGTEVLAQQLSAWVELATDPKQNPLIGKGVSIVAFTGNHELLVNKEDGNCKYAQCPNQQAYSYWPQFMANNPAHYGFIAGDNGPKQGGTDGLLNDESKLSYTFRSGNVLFVILNTDSQIDHDTIGDVPMDWLKQRLQAAQLDPGVRHVFVMGHKPLQSSDKGGDPGDRTIRPEQAEAFYALLDNPAGDGSPSKVRAFLAAHAHEWELCVRADHRPFHRLGATDRRRQRRQPAHLFVDGEQCLFWLHAGGSHPRRRCHGEKLWPSLRRSVLRPENRQNQFAGNLHLVRVGQALSRFGAGRKML